MGRERTYFNRSLLQGMARPTLKSVLSPLAVMLFASLLFVFTGASLALANGDDACVSCHEDPVPIHGAVVDHATAATLTGTVKIFKDGGHDDAGSVFEVDVNCYRCHTNNLTKIHGNSCGTCHPTPFDSIEGVWPGDCVDCHTVYHKDSTKAHEPFENPSAPYSQCIKCHDGTTWAVTDTKCQNCHASYTPDTTPPVTSSDAQATYIGGAVITFSITDNGKVGIGTTFYKLNGAPVENGSGITLNSPGKHTLEFWSVDQAGNVESPTKTVSFDIFSEIIPPVTTSDIQAAPYYQGAKITLTATDNSPTGVRYTYYKVNGGDTQVGNIVSIPATPGTFNYTLTYWSEDWGHNIETLKQESFTVISGNATLRLVWGDNDEPGFPYPPQPGHVSNYTVRLGSFTGAIVRQGSLTYPWNGVQDISVPLRPANQKYFVRVLWQSPYWGETGQADFSNLYPTAPGQIIRLSY